MIFLQVLEIWPNMPEVFNYLGIYLTQAGKYDTAYEAFDSVLELNPTYNYAYLNRGVALYYGGQYRLAQDNLQEFYRNDPNDSFRSLWLFLIEKKSTMVKRILRYKDVMWEQINGNGNGILSSST